MVPPPILLPSSSQLYTTSSTSNRDKRGKREDIASPLSSSTSSHSSETTPASGAFIQRDAICRSDVLSGRGNGVGQHIGNIEFRSIIRAYADTYSSTIDLNEKQLIVLEIKNKVEMEHRGRFLAQVDDLLGIYRPLNWSEIRQKIKQALRDSSKRKNRSFKNKSLRKL